MMIDERKVEYVENVLTRRLVYTIVGVKGGHQYARLCEVRVHAPEVDPRGRGYVDRCEEVHTGLDLRHAGPRSALGKLIAELNARGIFTEVM